MITFVEIHKDNFHEFQEGILAIENVSFPSPWSRPAFWHEMNRPISHFWALTMAQEVVGYICFWVFAREMHLMNIAVHPERRGKGLGHCLLEKMIEKGEVMGVKSAWLEVRPSNHVAAALYEKAGFRKVGRRLQYYRDTNEDGIIMALSFSPPQERAGHCSSKEPKLQRALGNG